jgi:hypothetical protein
MSNDMDELAGVFAQGSVQSNRMLNETVGGMQLLSASAGALTEFDLRVWVETWVEPVLSQVVKLIKHYESDEVVISVAGDRAGLIENLVAGQGGSKKPLDPQGQQQDAEEAQNPFELPVTIHDALSNLDKAQVAVKVNVGIGALDTTQRMQKFMGGVNITKDLAPLLQEQGIQPNGAALLQEAWGLCGYKDGDRFFTVAPPKQDDGPPPEAQLEMLKQKGTMSKAQLDADTKLQIEHIKADVEAQKLSLQEREFAYQQMITQMSINQQQQTQNLDYIMRLLESVVPGHAAQPRQIVQQPSQTAQVTQFPQAR